MYWIGSFLGSIWRNRPLGEWAHNQPTLETSQQDLGGHHSSRWHSKLRWAYKVNRGMFETMVCLAHEDPFQEQHFKQIDPGLICWLVVPTLCCEIYLSWGSHVSRRRKGMASDTPPFRHHEEYPLGNPQVQTDEGPGESCIASYQRESTWIHLFFGRIWDMKLYKSIIFTIKHDILGEKRELGWF